MHPRREHPIFISIGLECWLRAIRYTKIVPRVVGEQFCVRKSFSGLAGSNSVYENPFRELSESNSVYRNPFREL